MIEIKKVKKSFEDIEAVAGVSLTIKDKTVFGMLGTNGAGKSTLLRMMAGVIRPDSGKILIDGKEVYSNPSAKAKCFYVSDEQYYYPSATIKDMERFYRTYHPGFDRKKFRGFIEQFNLPGNRKIAGFSKGMKKQLSILLGICSNARYLLLDETFDGLDPVMRQGVKSIFASEMEDRSLTPVIASHNLRELEDICDHVGLLHEGGILLSEDLADLKCNLHKVQMVADDYHPDELKDLFEVVQLTVRGRLVTMTVRGEEPEIESAVKTLNPVYYELLPLSLEEIFISETEGIGYDIKNIIS